MITYTVKYKLPNQWFWKKLTNIREDGIVESAYADETFANWGSLNLFLQHHVIDELEETEVVSRVLYPNEEL